MLLFSGFVAYGAVLTTYGAAVPRVISDFGWSYAVTGLVLAASAVGFFVTSFLTGLLIEGARLKRVYVAALCICAGAITLFARWPSPALNLVLSFVVGIGQGMIEVVTNFETVRIEKQGQSRLMNLLHAGFSLGAITAPLAIGALLQRGRAWQIAFPASGAVFLIIAFAAALTPFPPPAPGAHRTTGRRLTLLKQPVLILLCAAIVLYLGSELGATNWLAEYFVRVLHAGISVGSSALSALWMGLLVGRLALSAFKTPGRQAILLLALSLLCMASLIALLEVRGILAAIGIVFALGLGYSGIYPLVVSLAGQAFRSSAAVGMLGTASGIGSFSFPYLFAGISQAAGLKAGFLFLAALPLGIAVVSLFLIRLLPRSQRKAG